MADSVSKSFQGSLADRTLRFAQVALVLGGLVMAWWSPRTWWWIAMEILLGVCTLTPRLGVWIVRAGWALTLALGPGLIRSVSDDSGQYVALISWSLAGSMLSNAIRPTPTRARWKNLCAVWSGIGVSLWLGGAYAENRPGAFYFGISVCLLWLAGCKRWLKLPVPLHLAVNTLLLLLVGLPLADWVVRPRYQITTEPAANARYYSFETAKRDPIAFQHWWRYFVEQWESLARDITGPDPTGVLPYRLVPGSQGHLLLSRIVINRQGFRGRDITEKGNRYRIVALGESTTFGSTLEPADRPWPEILEELIRRELGLDAEVINAGIPGFNIENNARRVAVLDILPLKPDLIISYHGYNGFNLLNASLPAVYGRGAPAYRPRPLILLADCEYQLRLRIYRRKSKPAAASLMEPSALLQTRCAHAYGELIEVARTNGIRLALANFSMAVNRHSNPEVIGFYRAGFPAVNWQIQANEMQSLLLKKLAEENQEILLLDTQPGLDGNHTNFIDLVHLTQPGRDLLARRIFEGIRSVLEQKANRQP